MLARTTKAASACRPHAGNTTRIASTSGSSGPSPGDSGPVVVSGDKYVSYHAAEAGDIRWPAPPGHVGLTPFPSAYSSPPVRRRIGDRIDLPADLRPGDGGRSTEVPWGGRREVLGRGGRGRHGGRQFHCGPRTRPAAGADRGPAGSRHTPGRHRLPAAAGAPSRRPCSGPGTALRLDPFLPQRPFEPEVILPDGTRVDLPQSARQLIRIGPRYGVPGNSRIDTRTRKPTGWSSPAG